jgi:hypothetical protein
MNWGVGSGGRGAIYSYPGQELTTHIRQFLSLSSALVGKVKTEGVLTMSKMLMDWKFAVVYGMEKKQVRGSYKLPQSGRRFLKLYNFFFMCLLKSSQRG